MAINRMLLNLTARILGVFPLVERRAPRERPRAGSRHADWPPLAFGSPLSWTTDFTSRTRNPYDEKPPLPRRSWSWTYYSIVEVTVVLSAVLYNVIHDFLAADEATGVRWTTRTDEYATLCEYLSLVTAACSYAVFSWLYADAVTQYAGLIAEVDHMLGLPPPPPKRWLAVLMAGLLGVLVTDASVWLATGSNTLWDAAKDIPLYLTYYTCFASEVLFMSDGLAIRERLRAINRILESCTPRPGKRTALGVPVALLPRTLTVPRLAAAHALLCHAMAAVSRRYGVPLLVDMTALLVNLVTTSYFFLEDLLPFWPAPADYTLTVMELAFACSHFTRIVMLVEPAAAAARESERTGELVGYLCSMVPYDSLMCEQLRAMSTQLRHQRGAFSNCGLFEMNRSILVSILGSVATYLLVLLQLKPPPSKALARANRTRAAE